MIILISGSINSGKTTVSKLLAKKIPSTAVVEVDSLRAMVDWMPLKDSIPLNLTNAVSVARNFIFEGLNVVIPYPLSEKDYQFMIEGLEKTGEEIFAFTLAPSLEVSLKNRGNRELEEKEKSRIIEQYASGVNVPNFGEAIDNSNLTPDETVELIMGKLV